MVTGTVKWFSPAKGYGLITPDHDGADVLAHYSAIHGHDYRLLYSGQKVQFEVKHGTRGPRATQIKRLRPDTKR
ncbi:cold-shock protein [Arthrobacter pigmenti]